jgi:hypothetical protein
MNGQLLLKTDFYMLMKFRQGYEEIPEHKVFSEELLQCGFELGRNRDLGMT